MAAGGGARDHFQRLFDQADEPLPLDRQPGTPSVALEQGHACPALDDADAPAHRAVGDRELRGSGRKGAGALYRQYGLESVERRQVRAVFHKHSSLQIDTLCQQTPAR